DRQGPQPPPAYSGRRVSQSLDQFGDGRRPDLGEGPRRLVGQVALLAPQILAQGRDRVLACRPLVPQRPHGLQTLAFLRRGQGLNQFRHRRIHGPARLPGLGGRFGGRFGFLGRTGRGRRRVLLSLTPGRFGERGRFGRATLGRRGFGWG